MTLFTEAVGLPYPAALFLIFAFLYAVSKNIFLNPTLKTKNPILLERNDLFYGC
jgi:hypothetical protein